MHGEIKNEKVKIKILRPCGETTHVPPKEYFLNVSSTENIS